MTCWWDVTVAAADSLAASLSRSCSWPLVKFGSPGMLGRVISAGEHPVDQEQAKSCLCLGSKRGLSWQFFSVLSLLSPGEVVQYTCKLLVLFLTCLVSVWLGSQNAGRIPF